MAEAPEKTIQKLQLEIVVLSLILVVGAMIWTWQIGMAANSLDHRLGHATEDIAEMQQTVARLEAKRP